MPQVQWNIFLSFYLLDVSWTHFHCHGPHLAPFTSHLNHRSSLLICSMTPLLPLSRSFLPWQSKCSLQNLSDHVPFLTLRVKFQIRNGSQETPWPTLAYSSGILYCTGLAFFTSAIPYLFQFLKYPCPLLCTRASGPLHKLCPSLTCSPSLSIQLTPVHPPRLSSKDTFSGTRPWLSRIG